MRKIFLAVLLLTMGVTTVMAQQVYNSSGKTNYKKKKKTGYDPDKLVLGIGPTFGIQPGYTTLGVSPIVGYRIQKPLTVGVGLGYLYVKQAVTVDQFDNVQYGYLNMVYPSLWARCVVYRQYYVTGALEYDIIKMRVPQMDYNGNFEHVRRNVTNQCLLIGAGMKQPLSGRVSAYFELVYDVLQGTYSPYPSRSPAVRLGVFAGI